MCLWLAEIWLLKLCLCNSYVTSTVRNKVLPAHITTSFTMTSSRLQTSRVLVLLLVGVCVVLIVMYFHLTKELCLLRNYINAQSSVELQTSRAVVENAVSSTTNIKRNNKRNKISALGHKGLDFDNLIVIYNRVPKTGSTSFIGLAYDLCSKNKFNVINVNTTKKTPTLSLTDQVRLVNNISNWEERKPGIYHGHLAYLDFDKFGANVQPVYINIIRKPLDRLVSHYYFIRYGDDLRPERILKKMGDKMTLDECVAMEHPDCSTTHLWMQIPFFCGHYAECWVPGSSWALELAKHNLVHNYFLVGVTEELEDFVAMLEYSLPRLFKGALELYLSGSKSHIRKTAKKIVPSDETVAKLESTKVMQLENEFYNFALDHFHFIRKKTLKETEDGNLVDKGKNFVYGKIKPKKYRETD